jgi:hypothetical protein
MGLVDWTSLGKGLSNAAEGAARNLQMGFANTVNRAGEMTYDAGQKAGDLAHHAAQALGWTSPPDRWAAYPSYMRGTGDPEKDANFYPRMYARAELGGYDPRTLPKQIPNIAAYRADPTGRFGGKDGLETQPTRFNVDSNTSVSGGGSPVDLYAYARELARAGRYGVPQLSAQQLAALALKEGRENYGSNGADTRSPANLALAKKLYPHEDFKGGYGLFGPKDFPVAVAEKMAVSKRLGIPFAEAWNGTGRNVSGTSGAQYARNFQAYLQAAQNPKNKPLVDLIQSALDAEAPRK